MYTPYLMCAYAATLLLVLAGLQVVRRSAPDLRGVAFLRQFIVCATCGVLLIALRPQLVPLFSIVAANYFFFAGVIFLYAGATQILSLPPRLLPALVALCVLTLPLFLWFTYVRNIPLVRLEIHCSVIACILSVTVVLLLRHGQGGLRYPAHAAAWILGTAVAVHCAWGISDLFIRPTPTFMRPDAINAGFSYLSMILGLGNVVSLAWLSLCVHRQELQIVAQTDSLTGLLNRGAFEESLRRELARCLAQGSVLGLMLVDIDYFKQVNDEHGHLAGDDVLRRISATLRAGIRPSDVLARYGGEEFVILLHSAGPAQTEEVAERLRADVADLVSLPGGVRLTASFGVAVSQPQDSVSSLLVRADEALYRSKRDGRNRVRVHSAVAGPALVR
ncbi:MAG TPA: GGDEF domain-containing protein [Acidobacteriaceae bacterium]|nr:GGDEF domain-containing protein [Acidobacteriaceae bacterium]